MFIYTSFPKQCSYILASILLDIFFLSGVVAIFFCIIFTILFLLQMLLAKEQSRAEALSAEVIQLSAQLTQTVQAYNSLTRM